MEKVLADAHAHKHHDTAAAALKLTTREWISRHFCRDTFKLSLHAQILIERRRVCVSTFSVEQEFTASDVV